MNMPAHLQSDPYTFDRVFGCCGFIDRLSVIIENTRGFCQTPRMSKDRPYHHGELQSAPLDLAVVEIERVGYGNLSLREMAAATGVSRGAPYRHFANRRRFLEALISHGLRMINDGLAQAAEPYEAPIEKVRSVFDRYLRFSEEHPQLYQLCFAADIFIDLPASDDYMRDVQNKFNIFSNYISLLVPKHDEHYLEALAISCWSLLHGFAMLSTTRRLQHILHDKKYDTLCRSFVIEKCLSLPNVMPRVRHGTMVIGAD
ncbi:TetR/AcrR family transcriptional regulator [Pseudomonas brenneri]|uniref:TetR/AcrR family transcriptional regulator n=1 Tax=Pseudomonas brenneri TaxID=129817 RepID=UPI003570F0C5